MLSSVPKILQYVNYLTNFSNSSDKIFYLYDFTTLRYRKCYQIDSLSYNLLKLQDAVDNTCTITCLDSYRLARNESEFRNYYELQKEYDWRSKIFNKGTDLYFFNNNQCTDLDLFNNNEWIKAEVAWTECHIVPGVLVLRYRKSIFSIGYYYYESLSLAESCTFTDKISQEELDNEKQKVIESKQKYELKKLKIKNIIKMIPVYNISNCDFRGPLYESQKEYHDPQIFAKSLKILSPDETDKLYKTKIEPDLNKKEDLSPSDKCFICSWLAYSDINYDGVELPFVLEKDNFASCFDLYKNIRITNLKPEDGYEIILSINDLTLDAAEWNDKEKLYYFPLLTNNYLFKIVAGQRYYIKFKKNNIFIDKPENVIITIDGIKLYELIIDIALKITTTFFIINDTRNRLFFFIGHAWAPSFVRTYEELQYDPLKSYKFNEELRFELVRGINT